MPSLKEAQNFCLLLMERLRWVPSLILGRSQNRFYKISPPFSWVPRPGHLARKEQDLETPAVDAHGDAIMLEGRP